MKLRDAAVLFGVSSVVLVVNVLLLSHHYQKKQQKYDNFIKTHSDFLPPPDAYDKAIPKTTDYYQRKPPLKQSSNDDNENNENNNNNKINNNNKNMHGGSTNFLPQPPQQPHRQHARTLIGIISSDSFNDKEYRKRHRILFEEIWKDKRSCTLAKVRATPEAFENCQVIYTFIIGSNPEQDAPTELLENTTNLPIERPQLIQSEFDDEINAADITRLNIKENMNEGKSQTFFYFASLMMELYGIDYAMKLDADSILHLHSFLNFSHHHLPPAPYNRNIFAGALRNKAGWPDGNKADLPRKESFFGNEFEGVHLYLAGQCYLMSYDLCQFVAQEAPYARVRVASGGYIEGHEDHDVSAMVFHSPTPIQMITIGKTQRFWEHPVKGLPRWDRIARRESARVKREMFEGKLLKIY